MNANQRFAGIILFFATMLAQPVYAGPSCSEWIAAAERINARYGYQVVEVNCVDNKPRESKYEQSEREIMERYRQQSESNREWIREMARWK